METTNMMTPSQVAQLTGLQTYTIQLFCQRGILPARMIDSRWYIPHSAVEQWAEQSGFKLGEDRLLHPKEVADRLGCAVHTVRYLCDTGRLRCVRIQSRGWRFVTERDLNAYLNARQKSLGNSPPYPPRSPNSGTKSTLRARARRRKFQPRTDAENGKPPYYHEVRQTIRKVTGIDPSLQQIRACLRAWRIRREGKDGLVGLTASKIAEIWQKLRRKAAPRRKQFITLLWVLYRKIPAMLKAQLHRYQQARARYRAGAAPEYQLPRLPEEKESAPERPPIADEAQRAVEPRQLGGFSALFPEEFLERLRLFRKSAQSPRLPNEPFLQQ